MKLVTLGTAGYHPNEYRHTTCVMIPEAGIIFDAGSSFFRITEYLETDTLDILLSHAHLDHVVGLTFLLDVLNQRPLAEVRVHGDSAKLAAIRRHLFSSALFPVEPPYLEKPLRSVTDLGEASVRHCTLEHPGGSIGYRVDWPNHSLAFITDTTARPEAAYVDLIEGVDLLIHECNFPDGQEAMAEKTGHSCLTPVAEVAREAGVGGLVLLHFNPLLPRFEEEWVRKAEQVFAPIVLAEDGMELEF